MPDFDFCHETSPIGFWQAEGAYGAFSNWAVAPFEYAGIAYPSVEHFIMRAKAVLMGDVEIARKIERCGSPAEAKALGRAVSGYNADLWERARENVAVVGIRARFQQDPDALTLLMATGDRLLVECSPTDRIWGVGIGEDDPAWTDPNHWHGKNLQGRAIMRARSDLRRWIAAAGEGGIGYMDSTHGEMPPIWRAHVAQALAMPSAHATVGLWRRVVVHLSGVDPMADPELTFQAVDEIMSYGIGERLPREWWNETRQQLFDLGRFGQL